MIMQITTADIRLAIYAMKIVNTKWYQFRKRKKLNKEATEFAKKNHLNW